MKLLRMAAALLSLVLLLAAFSACQTRGADHSAPQETASVEEQPPQEPDPASEPAEESASSAETAPDSPAADGSVRTSFGMSYLLDDPDSDAEEDFIDKSLTFSLDIPAQWTLDEAPYQIMLYDGDRIIAQVEMATRTADRENLFADIDAIGFDTFSIEELTVGGFPAKCYALKSGTEGSDEIKPTYSYYVAVDGVDDAYVLIFFMPASAADATQAEYDQIMATFRLV